MPVSPTKTGGPRPADQALTALKADRQQRDFALSGVEAQKGVVRAFMTSPVKRIGVRAQREEAAAQLHRLVVEFRRAEQVSPLG